MYEVTGMITTAGNLWAAAGGVGAVLKGTSRRWKTIPVYTKVKC